MRAHPDPRLEAAAAEALSDPAIAQGLTDFTLALGGVPVEPKEIRYRAEDIRTQDAPAMILEATLPGLWPPELEDEVAEVTVEVSGTPYREFWGRVRVVEPTDDGNTDIEAYTPGEWLDRQETGEEVAFSGHTPRRAMWQAVSAAPYERIDLSGVPLSPKLERETSEVFSSQAKRSELLADIREQAGAIFFDDADGTGRGMALSQLETPKDPEFSYVANFHTRRGGFKATPARDGRYSEVVIRRQGAGGEDEELRRFRVDNRAGKKKIDVPSGVVFPIEATDTSPEATTDALRRGMEAARMLEGGRYDFELEALVLDPRIIRGSVGLIEETRREGIPGADEREVTRNYVCIVAGYDRDPKQKSVVLKGAAFKVSEVEVDLSAASSAAFKGAREHVPTAPGPYGWDSEGFWYDDALVIAGVDENGFWVDPVVSGGNLNVDGGGFYAEES